MLKFLRKYKNILLVVGMSLLMVAFLLPDTIQRFGKNPGKQVVMRVNGRAITAEDSQRAASELRAAEFFSNDLARTLGRVSPEHWILLCSEAESGGYMAGAQDGRDFVADQIRQYGESARQQAIQRGETPPDLATYIDERFDRLRDQAAGQCHLTLQEVDRAVAKYMGVRRMINTYQSSVSRISDKRAIQEARKLYDGAIVDALFIPSTFVMGALPEPTEDQLAAHYEKFKTVKQGAGDFGVGYTLPPRVKVEWIKLDKDAVSKAIKVTDRMVFTRYLQESPADTEMKNLTKELRTTIETKIRTELADKALREMEAGIRAEVASALLPLELRGETRVLPADWADKRPKFADMAPGLVTRARQKLLKEDKVDADFPAPVVSLKNTEWLTQQDLARLDGIGRSYITRGTRREGFTALALSVKELGNDASELQIGVPGEATEDMQGNKYFFTVLDGRKESAPDSMTEIRETVVKDAKRIMGFETLKADIDAYRIRVSEQGFDALAKEIDDARPEAERTGPSSLRKAVTVSRNDGLFMMQDLNNDAFRDAVVAAAAALDPTKPVDTLPKPQRIGAVPVPTRLGVAIYQINALTPLTQEIYRTRDSIIVNRLGTEEMKDTEFDPFTFEVMQKRLKVSFDVPPKKKEDEKTKAS